MESMKCPSCGSKDLLKINPTEYECNHCNTRSKLSDNKKYLVYLHGYPCIECGFDNEADVKFCGNCGAKLVKYCLSCGAETRLGLKFCPNCGNSEFRAGDFVDVVFIGGLTSHKTEAIKIIRQIKHIGLRDAKNLVENGGVLVSSLSVDLANEIKDTFSMFDDLGKYIKFAPPKSSQSKNIHGQYSNTPENSQQKWGKTQSTISGKVNINEIKSTRETQTSNGSGGLFKKLLKPSPFKAGCLSGCLVFMVFGFVTVGIAVWLDNIIFGIPIEGEDSGLFSSVAAILTMCAGIIGFMYKFKPNSKISLWVKEKIGNIFKGKTKNE